MKKLILAVFACMLSLVSQAAIRTVNNVNGLEADYATITDALAASIDGDTVYVQPSPNSYGSFTLTKRLVIMGAGHNPSFSPYDSFFSQVSFGDGSGNSVLKGLSIQVITAANAVSCNNVLISGCKLNNPNNSPLLFNDAVMNGWIFEGCIMQSGGNSPILLLYLDANLIIRNCYVMSIGSYNVFGSVPSGTHIDHCILLTTGSSVYSGVAIGQNVLHTNNIISTSSANNNFGVDYSCTLCTFNNNLLWNAASAFPTPNLGTGNIVNADPQFAFFGYSGTYSYNWDFHVADNSQASNAATDGTDIGIYGGIFNFNHFGIDGGSPHIVDFSLGSSSAPQGGTITIHLNANGSGQ
jgi:hypothetical protein